MMRETGTVARVRGTLMPDRETDPCKAVFVAWDSGTMMGDHGNVTRDHGTGTPDRGTIP